MAQIEVAKGRWVRNEHRNRRLSRVWTWCALAAVAGSAAGLALAIAFDDALHLAWAGALAVVAAGATILARGSRVAGVLVTDHEVVVRNPLRTARLAHGDVDRFVAEDALGRLGSAAGVLLLHRDGRRLGVWSLRQESRAPELAHRRGRWRVTADRLNVLLGRGLGPVGIVEGTGPAALR